MRTITDHLTTIDGVSDPLASRIADTFDSYEALASASVDDLRAVKGVGPVLATRIQAAAIEASPAAATKARAGRAGAAARTTASNGQAKAKKTADKASSTVSARADKSATAAKAAASRAKAKASDTVDEATDAVADTTERAATATKQADRDFAASIDRRTIGPITLPADLPWPVNFALDTTEAVVGAGLKVTTGVLQTVGRKLR